jgi:hypothetical protein
VSEQGPDSPFESPDLESARSRSGRARRPSKLVALLATTGLLAIGVIAAVIGTRETDGGAGAPSPVPNGNGVGATEPETPGVSTTGGPTSVVVERPNAQLGSSLECYTFYPDNTVDLRLDGLPEVVDVGVVASGEIRWESGRASTVEIQSSGAAHRIAVDGVDGLIVEACD